MHRFVLIHGLLGFGLPMAVLTTVSGRVLFGDPWPSGVRLVTLILVWIFGGVAFGSIMWKLKQHRAAVTKPTAPVDSPLSGL